MSSSTRVAGIAVMSVLAAVAMASGPSVVEADGNATPAVARLDQSRYAGLWYEVARVRGASASACAGDAATLYLPRSGGGFDVLQRCRRPDGSIEQSVGTARLHGDGGRMEVNFLPSWFAWLPLGWSDHWVIDLDPSYRLAVVGDRSRKQVRILAREPSVEPAAFGRMAERLRQSGLDLDRLVPIPHSRPEPERLRPPLST